MLDSASCSRLTSPRLVSLLAKDERLSQLALITLTLALLLLALVGLAWSIRTLRRRHHLGQSKNTRPLSWKYQLTRLGTVILLIYLIVTLLPTFVAVRKGLIASIPNDPGTHVDAIVVLGRGKPFRLSGVEVAAELWKAKRAPTIFVSGRGDAPSMIELLKAKGIPAQVLAGEDCSNSTQENAQFTATLLQPQGVQRILLVTDSLHMLRSLLSFRSFGFTVIPHPSSPPTQVSPKDRDSGELREYCGLVLYSLLGWFIGHHF